MEIDVFYGIGDGESWRLEGELICTDDSGVALIQITDKRFKEQMLFGDDEWPWEIETTKLKDDHWVGYDDYRYCEKGFVKEHDFEKRDYWFDTLVGTNTNPYKIPDQYNEPKYHKVIEWDFKNENK
jgi:hypothetical protein